MSLDHPVGAPSWFELATRDQAAADIFYSALFGWTRRETPMPDGSHYTVFQLDGRGVATIVRLERDDSRPPLKADERRMRLREQHGQPLLVTDAWYFREGEAKAWETARYGEFRLRNDGRALLVGMADEQLQPIRPARP